MDADNRQRNIGSVDQYYGFSGKISYSIRYAGRTESLSENERALNNMKNHVEANRRMDV